MLRLTVLVCLIATLLACSRDSRLWWGEALQGAADRMGQTRTVYCTTYRSTGNTYCY